MTQLSTVFGGVGLLFGVIAVLSAVEALAATHRGRRRRDLPRANLMLTAMALGLNVVLAFVATAGVEAVWGDRPGLFERLGAPSLAMPIVAVVVLDFATWVAHVSMHRIPWLWRIHRVHHTDPVVDVTTSLRQHPFETVFRFAFIAAPALALGLPPHAVALYRLVSALNALFEHTDVRLWQPLDRLLSFAFSTPNVHKVHHSKRSAETDTNYGNILSLFDRLFGTFTPPARASRDEYGLDGYDGVDVGRLRSLLGLPFRGSLGGSGGSGR